MAPPIGNVAGTTDGGLDGESLVGDKDAFLAKYSPQGVWQWTRLLGAASASTDCFALAVTSDAVFVAGSTNRALPGSAKYGTRDLYFARQLRLGGQIGASGGSSTANALVWDGASALYLAGESDVGLHGQKQVGAVDGVLLKLGVDGQVYWTRHLGAAAASTRLSAATATAAGIMVAGSSTGSVDGTSQPQGKKWMVVAVYDATGTRSAVSMAGGATGDTEALGAAHDSSGLVYVAGTTGVNLSGQGLTGTRDAFLAKYSASGTKLKTGQYGVAGLSTVGRAVAVDQLTDTPFVVGGTYGALNNQTLNGEEDLLVILAGADASLRSARLIGASGARIEATAAQAAAHRLFIGASAAGALPGQTATGTTDMAVVTMSQVFF